MQYTIRNIPGFLDSALRQRAEHERKSLNQVVVDCLVRALGLSEEPVRQRDLSAVAGTWQRDPTVDEALDEQRRVDADLWN